VRNPSNHGAGSNDEVPTLSEPLAVGSELPDDRPLPSFHFSLRHMFWGVTLACLVLAATVAVAELGTAPLALLLIVFAVVLHVVGTAIGTQLRDHADEQYARRPQPTVQLVASPTQVVRPSSLHQRGLPLPWLSAWIAIGLVLGGVAGAGLFSVAIGHRATPVGIAVGGLSTAVLGGWFAFIAASSWTILRQGWREAVSDHHRDRVA
jgi:MFS family permease